MPYYTSYKNTVKWCLVSFLPRPLYLILYLIIDNYLFCFILIVMKFHHLYTISKDKYVFISYSKQCTMLGAPPPVFVLLAKHPIVDKYNLTSLKMSIMGAATTSKETLEEVRERIPTMTIFRQGIITCL